MHEKLRFPHDSALYRTSAMAVETVFKSSFEFVLRLPYSPYFVACDKFVLQQLKHIGSLRRHFLHRQCPIAKSHIPIFAAV